MVHPHLTLIYQNGLSWNALMFVACLMIVLVMISHRYGKRGDRHRRRRMSAGSVACLGWWRMHPISKAKEGLRQQSRWCMTLMAFSSSSPPTYRGRRSTSQSLFPLRGVASYNLRIVCLLLSFSISIKQKVE